jgi:hypothetical protein
MTTEEECSLKRRFSQPCRFIHSVCAPWVFRAVPSATPVSMASAYQSRGPAFVLHMQRR